MARKKKRVVPHYDFPKRKIVRTERQNGKPVIVMACGHGMVGTPASRMSRFYPCRACYDIVESHRAALVKARKALAVKRGSHGKP